MNKLAITSILVAAVLMAGIFAFMPVQKASTLPPAAPTATHQDIINELQDKKNFYEVGDSESIARPGDHTISILISLASCPLADPTECAFNVEGIRIIAAGLTSGQSIEIDEIEIDGTETFFSPPLITFTDTVVQTNLLIESGLVQLAGSQEIQIQASAVSGGDAMSYTMHVEVVGQKPQVAQVEVTISTF